MLREGAEDYRSFIDGLTKVEASHLHGSDRPSQLEEMRRCESPWPADGFAPCRRFQQRSLPCPVSRPEDFPHQAVMMATGVDHREDELHQLIGGEGFVDLTMQRVKGRRVRVTDLIERPFKFGIIER